MAFWWRRVVESQSPKEDFVQLVATLATPMAGPLCNGMLTAIRIYEKILLTLEPRSESILFYSLADMKTR